MSVALLDSNAVLAEWSPSSAILL